ncbi:MAG: hypothetical protein RLZZ308_570 [Candidatus Parcubacteria bacterium]|jgi:dUTP pyrophosphatase
MQIRIQKVRDGAQLPTRAHHDDAGMDIYTCGVHTVMPGETKKIPTGVAFQLPDNCVALVWDKSSLGMKGLKTLGGVVDAGYRGEIFILIHNMTQEAYTFSSGDKVAQILIQKVEFPELIEVSSLDESFRGHGGFGSTGK